MPDKKKKATATEDTTTITATEWVRQRSLLPPTSNDGTINLLNPHWMDYLQLNVPQPDADPLRLSSFRRPAEPEPEDIFAERDYIADTITLHAYTVQEAMPELRRRYVQALVDTIHECQRLRGQHEQLTGRPVRKVKLEVDSLVKNVVVYTVAYEEPEEVIRLMDEALELAANDFKLMKELPAVDDTRITEQSRQARMRQDMDNRAVMHGNVNLLTPVQTYSVTPTQQKEMETERGKEIITDHLNNSDQKDNKNAVQKSNAKTPSKKNNDKKRDKENTKIQSEVSKMMSDPKTKKALEDASKATGIPLDYLMVMAIIESGGNRKIGTNGYGYTGLMQMGKDAVKDVEKIDPKVTWEGVNDNVEINALAGAGYMHINKNKLQEYNIPITVLNLYLSHQQGAPGFNKLLKTLKTNPNKEVTPNQKNNIIHNTKQAGPYLTQQEFYESWKNYVTIIQQEVDKYLNEKR